jgi:hypothetical protein
MKLQRLENEWSAYLASENCPPVLGLAPLSEDDCELIRQLVTEVLAQYSQPPWRLLYALLETFPASTSVWFARKAGEAYESGAFWEKFGDLIGIPVPLNHRTGLAQRFRVACRRKMSTWVAPTELGGHNIVAEFLHQAGLPLDRCQSFAQHVRKVERTFGLPDPDDAEAGEQLREAVLDSLMPVYVPTLKRALRGPAGPRICEVALNVVLKGDYKGINPRLGRELERVFESAGPGALRRSAHQPFLRLGEDLSSLEVVGPRQDPSLVGERGLTWLVDGRRYPTPRTDEFVTVVTERPRVTIELAGLAHSQMPLRTFVLRLDDLAEPFMLFDERTRRQRRAGGAVPSGSYWLLHRAADSVFGADQTYEWPEDERALTLLTLRPGSEARLESSAGGPWHFSTTLTPFFDPVGQTLTHEGWEPVHFNWAHLPFVWLPLEEAEPDRLAEWRVNAAPGGDDLGWRVSPAGEEAGGMVKCRVEAGDFLGGLPEGMHRLGLTLRRGGRARAEGHAEFWYWKGLHRHSVRGFQLTGRPANLVSSECRGFTVEETAIRHQVDPYRRHTLVFDVGGQHAIFNWAQPGVFLESLERGPGQPAKPRPHALGDAFSASLRSSRWLKIWLSGNPDWEVFVAGRRWLRSLPGDVHVREFVELSLASLALTFPLGGDVMLRAGGGEWLVARFSSPLQPVGLERVDTDVEIGYRFEFPEPVVWARPVVRDLASGRRLELEGQRVDEDGQASFATPGLPRIECASAPVAPSAGAPSGRHLTLAVPRHGWAEGFWLVELEVRRDEQSEWERAVLRGGQYAPLIIPKRGGDEQPPAGARERLFWDSFAPGSPLQEVTGLDEQGPAELFELLAELIALRQRATAAAAQNNMGWLKDAVRALSQFAGRVARQPGGDELRVRLLNLACQDSSHAGFVHLPGLLALPGIAYRELPSGYPLNDALRRCGWVAAADSVSQLVRSDFEFYGDFKFFDRDVVGCFANFAQVVMASADEPTALEFRRFNFEQYWQVVIGTLHGDNLAPDWSGEGVLLGKAHLVWALDELVRRYEQSGRELNLAAANTLLRSAHDFREWLRQRLGAKSLMPEAAWREPWPQFKSPEVDFLEAAPRFASLFALAARSAAAGWINFDEAITWLERRVPRRWMAEEGITVLVSLAPELFGNQLQFWELILRTAPHKD